MVVARSEECKAVVDVEAQGDEARQLTSAASDTSPDNLGTTQGYAPEDVAAKAEDQNNSKTNK